MADAVSTLTILEGSSLLTQKFTNLSDGTGESAVTKVTLSSHTSTMRGGVSVTPVAMIIEKIVYDIKGFAAVKISAAGTTPVVLAQLTGFGTLDYEDSAGLNSTNTGTGAGNITFTTVGAAANASYDITLFMRKDLGNAP